MPFHVEIGSSFNHARAFNLEEPELRRAVLEPWVGGLPFEFEEREWEPRESRLTILEGATLEPPDLAFGQGWSNALRQAEDVTRQMLEAAHASAPVRSAAVIAADSMEAALASLGAGQPPRSLPWEAALKRMDGRDPEIAAVILVVRPSGS
jgi:MoxR-like ATPase